MMNDMNGASDSMAGMGAMANPGDDEHEEGSKHEVSFEPPKGWVAPEHQGEEFDLVCTFRQEGKEICLVKLGDTPMDGDDSANEARAKNAPDNKPGYGEYASKMTAGLGQMAGGA